VGARGAWLVFAVASAPIAACGGGASNTGSSGTNGSSSSGVASGGMGGASNAGGGGSRSSTGSSNGGGGAGGGSTSAFAFYGNPWSADALENWNLGGPKTQRWAYRFRAPRDGKLDHLRVFFIANPVDHSKTGYAGGNGGAVHVELCDDDGSANHFPDCGSPLGTTDKSDFALVGGSPVSGFDEKQTYFPALPLASPVTVSAGKIYHAVFTNSAPDPVTNYISLDGLVEFGNEKPASMRPSFVDWGLSLGSTTDSGWSEWTTGGPSTTAIETPVMALHDVGGFDFGCGYMEVWPSDAQSRPIDATHAVRETIEASRDFTAKSVSVRVKRTGAGGSLDVRLETSGGALVAEASIDASAVDPTRDGWVQSAFSSPAALVNGKSYALVLRGAGGGAFSAFCTRDGQTWGFEPGSVFADGHAEFDSGDGQGFLGWYGYDPQGSPAYQDGDLQFYLVP
jgi:hypothetical protein